MKVNLGITIAFFCLCEMAQAEDYWKDPPDETSCGDLYSSTYGPDFRFARVMGPKEKRVYFLQDSNGCPKAGESKCRWEEFSPSSYLVPGDRVLVSRKYESWICGWRVTPEGDEGGWLLVKDLEFIEPDLNPSLEKWIGTWRYNYNVLKITLNKETQGLRVVGKAIYRSPRGDYWGKIDAAGEPKGTELRPLEKISEGYCQVRFRLIDDSLIVSDNSSCGGPNVRFDGLYQKENKAVLSDTTGKRKS
ncbi:MAG: hypothetical protein AAB578_04990 [Elusimicrobiota bacterium]